MSDCPYLSSTEKPCCLKKKTNSRVIDVNNYNECINSCASDNTCKGAEYLHNSNTCTHIFDTVNYFPDNLINLKDGEHSACLLYFKRDL